MHRINLSPASAHVEELDAGLPQVEYAGDRFNLAAEWDATGTSITLRLIGSPGAAIRTLIATCDTSWRSAFGAIVLRNRGLHACLNASGFVSAMCLPCPGLGDPVVSQLTSLGLLALESSTVQREFEPSGRDVTNL